MKKSHLFYLILLLLLPAFALVSCDSDDDLPKVAFTVDFGNPVVNDTVYAVAGDSLAINSVVVKNAENNNDKVVLSQVAYYLDGFYLGTAIFAPYSAKLYIPENARLGRHSLMLQAPVLMENHPLAEAYLGYNLKIVASADDIPGEAAPDTIEQRDVSYNGDGK